MNLADKGEPPSIEVQFAVAGHYCPPQFNILRWSEMALESATENLTVRIVEEQEIKELNERYRKQNKVTNVLSFPAEIPIELNLRYLGDIAICASVVNAEAIEQNKSCDAHWAHMVVHGILHLRGYDHVDSNEALIMEQYEIQLLEKIGFGNPYCQQANGRATHV